MEFLTIEECAEYLEFANIHKSIDKGHAIIHIGTTMAGVDFVLVNNFEGETMLTEGL
jgi:hypothetical protein